MSERIALIAGATGLVGRALVDVLLQNETYDRIKVLVRQVVPEWQQHERLQQLVVDYDHLERHAANLQANDVYCCLGTTIKQAGSQARMYEIDVTYPLRLAELARQQGATHWLVVSAMGADASARIFYSRIKGELEQQLRTLGYPFLSIVQPSLLLGKREQFRAGERAAAVVSTVLSPLLRGNLAKYKPIQAETVARAMYRLALELQRGTNVYTSSQLQQLGSE
ncbi:oxidoreductase [Paenibacillus campi]|uniref:oxidoreductase n=1 Tax=Paenibacillus campi TaxID=3106031 RepID=UPI002AFE3340|nr:oxidoreductase [Paenibacillus sp. SGZ-1014]